MIAEANSTRDRSALLIELRNTLERLKIHLILAKEVQAFNRARTFYQATEMAVAVSRQNEGWLKSMAGKSSPSHKSRGRTSTTTRCHAC